MSEAVETPKAGWRMKVAIFALAVSVFTVLWFAIAALGTKWGFWPWQVGLGQMTIGIGPGMIFPAEMMSDDTRQAVVAGFVAAKNDIDQRMGELEPRLHGRRHAR